MISEQDIVNAAGSEQNLLEIFGVTDSAAPAYQEKLVFALDEAHAVLTEHLGITFADGAIAALPRDEKLPLVLLGSRYAVLSAKAKGRGRLEDGHETDEFRQITDRLQAIAAGASWPGRTRPAPQKTIRQGFVPRRNLAPTGFRR